MNGPLHWSRRARRLCAVAVLSGMVLIVLAIGALGAGPQNDSLDARNKTHGEKNGGNPSLDCWSHHRGEGMLDSHVVVPIFPQEVLPDTEDTFKVQVVNSWKYDISELQVDFRLKGDQALIVPSNAQIAEGASDLYQAWQGQLGNGQLSQLPDQAPSERIHNFTIFPQATGLFAQLELHFKEATKPPSGSPLVNHLKVVLLPPGARTQGFSFTPRPPEGDTAYNRTLAMDPKNLASGDWRFKLNFTDGGAPVVDYYLNVTVLYQAASGQAYTVFYTPRVPNPADPLHPLPFIKKGGVYSIDVPVRILGKGTQEIEVAIRALLYYKHQDGKTPNEDHFNRYATVQVKVGEQRIESEVQGASAASIGVDARLAAGEVSGFAAAFLLLPSLLFGGTYGKASRKFFNLILGGAKRRVMYHNLVSLGLTFIAIFHILMFMIEIRYTVLMGVLFGGLGALSLLVLGLTGFYQVPLIQKYGYNWWRYTHLIFGILVVLFVGYHAIADGPDFFFIKQQIPQWINDLNFAQK